jgi:hypothetical protein
MLGKNLRRRHAGYAVFALALAAGLVSLSAGSNAANPAKDNYNLTITGNVPASCTFVTTTPTLDIGTATTAATSGSVRLAYKCNSTYSLSVTSSNGGQLKSASNETIDYTVDFALDGGATLSGKPSLPTATQPTALGSGLSKTTGPKNGTLTVKLDATQYDAATYGAYTDTLTLTITGS